MHSECFVSGTHLGLSLCVSAADEKTASRADVPADESTASGRLSCRKGAALLCSTFAFNNSLEYKPYVSVAELGN